MQSPAPATPASINIVKVLQTYWGPTDKKSVQCIHTDIITFLYAKHEAGWQLWDLNPRPGGPAPEAGALDHSAKLPIFMRVHDMYFQQVM